MRQAHEQIYFHLNLHRNKHSPFFLLLFLHFLLVLLPLLSLFFIVHFFLFSVFLHLSSSYFSSSPLWKGYERNSNTTRTASRICLLTLRKCNHPGFEGRDVRCEIHVTVFHENEEFSGQHQQLQSNSFIDSGNISMNCCTRLVSQKNKTKRHETGFQSHLPTRRACTATSLTSVSDGQSKR
jgi:hypothetical protein